MGDLYSTLIGVVIGAILGLLFNWLLSSWQIRKQQQREELRAVEEALLKLKEFKEVIENLSYKSDQGLNSREHTQVYKMVSNEILERAIFITDMFSWIRPYLNEKKLAETELPKKMEGELLTLNRPTEAEKQKEVIYRSIQNLKDYRSEFYEFLLLRRLEIIKNKETELDLDTRLEL